MKATDYQCFGKEKEKKKRKRERERRKKFVCFRFELANFS